MLKLLTGVILLGVLFILVGCKGTQTVHSTPSPTRTHHPVIAVVPTPTTIHTAHSSFPAPKPKPTPAPVVTHTTALCKFHYQLGEPLPDPMCTPGSIQSSDTKAICTPGWATAHRMYFTKSEREAAFAKYGVHTLNPAGYGEYDHLIPLELGGSNNPDNLWPEKGSIPNQKDAIENALHGAVCSGKTPLAVAQQEIAKDWVTVPDTFQAP